MEAANMCLLSFCFLPPGEVPFTCMRTEARVKRPWVPEEAKNGSKILDQYCLLLDYFYIKNTYSDLNKRMVRFL